MNLNKAFLIGRLTGDPQTKSLPSGQQVCNFSIATDRFFTDKSGQKQQQTEFHNIVTFGKTADIASQYLTKGSLVLIEGRLQTRTWQDSSGNRRYKTEIIAENIQLPPKSMTPKKQENIPIIEEGKNEEKPSSAEEPQANLTTNHPSEDDEEIDIEKIPF